MKKIMTVIGTRPEIIKMARLLPLLDKNFDHTLIHTQQHYNFKMDQVFFQQLHLREPDFYLQTRSKSPALQISHILQKLQPIIHKIKPDLILTYADTNSALGGSLAAIKNSIKLAHLEAGCRSFDRSMPEETNRVMIDSVSDFCFASDNTSVQNLLNEGIEKGKITLSGRTIYTVLKEHLRHTNPTILDEIGIKRKEFLLVTFHRAGNTDDKNNLVSILKGLNLLSKKLPIVFPIHPRTAKAIRREGLIISTGVHTIPPQGYFEFLTLLENCLFTVTDSGGIQEEAAILSVPALIVRSHIEWPEFVKVGKNQIAGNKFEDISRQALTLINNPSQLEKMRMIKYPWIENPEQRILEKLKSC